MNTIIHHNVLNPWPLPDECVHTIVTSPPYWGLRDYMSDEQIGQESTPELYIQHLVQVFRHARKCLREDGTLWLNLADTYWGGKGQSGAAWKGEHIHSKAKNWANKGDTRPQDRNHPLIKPKDLCAIPWEVAIALRNDGWYLRQDIVWNKPNPMPESMKDRCTKAHEYIFMLSKSRQYYFDQDAIKEPMVEYERQRRLREAKQGLTATYSIARDGKTGQQDQSQGGAIRNSKRRQELAEDGNRNKRTVWTCPTGGFDAEFCTSCRRYYEGKTKQLLRVTGAGTTEEKLICLCGRHDAWIEHFATFPPELIVDCIKAGAVSQGLVCDPFMGAGTTGLTALAQGRQFVGFDVNPDYIDLANHRIQHHNPLFFTV